MKYTVLKPYIWSGEAVTPLLSLDTPTMFKELKKIALVEMNATAADIAENMDYLEQYVEILIYNYEI